MVGKGGWGEKGEGATGLIWQGSAEIEVVVKHLYISEKPPTALSGLEGSGVHQLITPVSRVGPAAQFKGWDLGLTLTV